MNKEKTLDEALDQFDRWGDHVSRAIESLSPDQMVKYFKQAKSRLEEQCGKTLLLGQRHEPPARTPRNAGKKRSRSGRTPSPTKKQ